MAPAKLAGSVRGYMRLPIRGFGLLELMITVALLAILAGIALPSFQTTIRSNRVTTATNNLLAAINQARGEAVTRARPVTVCAASSDRSTCSASAAGWDTNGWLIVCTNAAGTTAESCTTGDEDEALLRVFEPGTQVEITTTVTHLTFDRRGAVPAQVDFALEPDGCSGTQRRELQVNIMGRTRSLQKSCTT